ncbi:unnamed protein product, partial [Didymodactylos carnosus]
AILYFVSAGTILILSSISYWIAISDRSLKIIFLGALFNMIALVLAIVFSTALFANLSRLKLNFLSTLKAS